MMKWVKKLIFYLVVVIVFLMFVGNIASRLGEVYNVSRFMNVIVLSGSMEPEMSPGDLITIVKVDKDKVEVGDVITYSYEGVKVTHKIISISEEEVITQGTANNHPDNPINKDSIIGKQIFVIPKVGYVINFFSTLPGIIILVGAFALYFFCDFRED